MCDTMGEVLSKDYALFAKNSDRSPNEPQVTEWYPAAKHNEKTVKTTYVDIEQVAETYAFVLSRPTWLWGGEMGVNEHGVCIGNEAVFTKGRYAKTGLTGMDLVRLGLERGNSARQALEVILELLERYGQGGDCGYDHSFFYDNSFLIMDRQELYILETAGKEWVWRQQEQGSISNRLSIGYEGDEYSGGHKIDFRAKYLEPVYSKFSGSKKRLAQTLCCIKEKPDLAGLFQGLRAHDDGIDNPLTQNSVSSTCMHAGGLVGDHTTASMVIELADEITVWVTGGSTPCISLFKPWRFGSPVAPPIFEPMPGNDAYWYEREQLHRAVIGHVLPPEFYTERDALEAEWLTQSRNTDDRAMQALTEQAVQQEANLYQKWKSAKNSPIMGNKRFLNFWYKKTQQLETPARQPRWT